MSKYYSIHEFSKIIGVSAQTLRNWDANGKLHPHHTTAVSYTHLDVYKRQSVGWSDLTAFERTDSDEFPVDKKQLCKGCMITGRLLTVKYKLYMSF